MTLSYNSIDDTYTRIIYPPVVFDFLDEVFITFSFILAFNERMKNSCTASRTEWKPYYDEAYSFQLSPFGFNFCY